MRDSKKRIKKAIANGDVEKFVGALRRSRRNGLVFRQLTNRKVEDVPAAYYGAIEEGFPVYTENDRDKDGKSIIRYLIGAE
jgi:hypothetical protein